MRILKWASSKKLFIPLGDGANAGIVISLGVMVLYYSMLIVTKNLARQPKCFPHLLVGLPTIICGVAAIILIRNNR